RLPRTCRRLEICARTKRPAQPEPITVLKIPCTWLRSKWDGDGLLLPRFSNIDRVFIDIRMGSRFVQAGDRVDSRFLCLDPKPNLYVRSCKRCEFATVNCPSHMPFRRARKRRLSRYRRKG